MGVIAWAAGIAVSLWSVAIGEEKLQGDHQLHDSPPVGAKSGVAVTERVPPQVPGAVEGEEKEATSRRSRRQVISRLSKAGIEFFRASVLGREKLFVVISGDCKVDPHDLRMLSQLAGVYSIHIELVRDVTWWLERLAPSSHVHCIALRADIDSDDLALLQKFTCLQHLVVTDPDLDFDLARAVRPLQSLRVLAIATKSVEDAKNVSEQLEKAMPSLQTCVTRGGTPSKRLWQLADDGVVVKRHLARPSGYSLVVRTGSWSGVLDDVFGQAGLGDNIYSLRIVHSESRGKESHQPSLKKIDELLGRCAYYGAHIPDHVRPRIRSLSLENVTIDESLAGRIVQIPIKLLGLKNCSLDPQAAAVLTAEGYFNTIFLAPDVRISKETERVLRSNPWSRIIVRESPNRNG